MAGRAFAAEAAPHVRSNDPHLFRREADGLRQLLADGEGSLRARPHRQLSALDYSDCGVRLHCGMGYVAVQVGLFDQTGGEFLSFRQAAFLVHHL